MPAAPDIDAPRCPSCNYDLTALTSLTCPECGTKLDADFSRYRPSASRPRWSIGFAIAVSLITILAWGAIREGTLAAYAAIARSPSAGMREVRYFINQQLPSTHFWFRLSLWEAWALARLWLLFAILALLLTPRSFASNLRRLLRFSPWLAILEIGLLIAVIIRCECVPEPSTIFVFPQDWLDIRSWLYRSAIPAPIVGFLFARWVLQWRMRSAIPFAIIFLPLFSYFSAAWSHLYLILNLHNLRL